MSGAGHGPASNDTMGSGTVTPGGALTEISFRFRNSAPVSVAPYPRSFVPKPFPLAYASGGGALYSSAPYASSAPRCENDAPECPRYPNFASPFDSAVGRVKVVSFVRVSQ